ncbi:MAG: hypothetical protein KJ787_01105 [Gammaproteobacteria bacterium]|nr:hypothetical protein [Gammaproteobacteria bacterium]MBU1644915.1 hypothetical protein [Gammaproteobacteria bacterium]MBU1971374.1 hypothetical protein [Gammaproteobacteria bacterium]
MKIATLASALLLAAAGPAFAADNIEGIVLEPNPARVGQPVTITVTGDSSAAVYCGLKVGFGDGSDQRLVVGDKEPFPKVTTHSYAAPGSYTVRADGTKVDGRFGCTGKVKVQLVVEAPPAAAMPAKATKAAGPACPEGYKMKGKAGKKGDFTCAAGKGAKKPEKVMDCADGLEYFQTKSQLGCRKVGKK